MSKKIYTMNIAVDILEKFDDVLCENGIKVPSSEDDERGEDNSAALYGSVYADLLDYVEMKLIDILNSHSSDDEIVYGVLQDLCDNSEKEEIKK